MSTEEFRNVSDVVYTYGGQRGKTECFTLDNHRLKFNAGLVRMDTKAPPSLLGVVWTDSNENGLIDSGEPLMNEVLVKLNECDSGKMVDATATKKTVLSNGNLDGVYIFRVSAEDGKYFVGTCGLVATTSIRIRNSHLGK